MSFRCRVEPSDEQAAGLARHCADARFVWNLGLEQRNFWNKERRGRLPSLSAIDQGRYLAEARQHSWLGDGSSAVQQQALRDLDQAFKNWWSNPGHFRRPTWRKAGRNEGFAIRDLRLRPINRKWAEVQVPKLGYVRFRLSGRTFQQVATGTTARVTLDRSGRWWVSFTAPQPPVKRRPTGRVVGVDMGVVTTAMTSDGARLDMPVFLTPGQSAYRLMLQRRLARQEPGSKRYRATRLALARHKAREAARRKDWIEKTTTALVRDYDLIGIEDLHVANMTRSASGTVESPGRGVAAKRGLNRSITTQAWGMFRTRLTQKAKAATDPDGTPRPVSVIAVPAPFTSQRCNTCDHSEPGNRESQAVFRCRECGHTDNADVNAARNIRDDALAVAQASGHDVTRGGNVRPVHAGRAGETRTSPPATHHLGAVA